VTGDALLDRYLAGVGIEHGAPTMPLLEDLIRRHLERYAFASIGPQLGDALPLDTESLFDRIVVRRRGGYCFEQNGLMFEILGALGFDTSLVLARVLLSGADHPPLTHRFTMVDLDDRRYLVDVGFGAECPPTPVLFDPSSPGDGRYRIVEGEPGEFHLQLATDDGHVSLYRFDLTRYGEADAELGHFYSHRHPEAAFVNNLVAARIFDGEVRSLRNLELRIRRNDDEQRIAVVDARHLRALLSEMFDLEVDEAEAKRLFAAAVERAQPI
jgi:N-hydroxyarylamine O-acetyltransferase